MKINFLKIINNFLGNMEMVGFVLLKWQEID